MSTPYDETDRPRPEDDGSWVGGPVPQPQPGAEPADPWAEDEARRRAEEQDRWVAEDGGLGPIPSRTWTRGNTRVTVGGCCLPLPLGCLTTVVAAGVVAGVSAARRRG